MEDINFKLLIEKKNPKFLSDLMIIDNVDVLFVSRRAS